MPRQPRSRSAVRRPVSENVIELVPMPPSDVHISALEALDRAFLAATWLKDTDLVLWNQLRFLVETVEMLKEHREDAKVRRDIAIYEKLISTICAQLGLDAQSRLRLGLLHLDGESKKSTLEELRAKRRT